MKQKPNGNKQKKPEWPKFVLTVLASMILPIILYLHTMWYEHWRDDHGILCNHTSVKWEGDLIKVRLSFENTGNKEESIIGASLYFPENDKNKGEPHYINGKWENLKFTPMAETSLTLTPDKQTDWVFEWPLKRADYAEKPYAVEIVFLDENNSPKNEVFPFEEINSSEHGPFEGIDLFDGKERPGTPY